ncbi:hypothetical protein Acr_29g0006680 [Actinidia rufa]|uniref:FBD domain-containing protein n=1 Tax=Actinidia rufa TaxID=165716 RepID=A0A7J0HEH4_9ERIC|nr:hypothetical protein Acr_29g0006680 [Actinidia rufa]
MKRIQSSTSDEISNLPSNVTEIILMRLRLRDAVRTCVLSSRWSFEFLEINAPNLKVFIFWGSLNSISFKSTPLLAEISITLISFDAKEQEKEIDSNWVKFFRCLPAIEDLHLDGSVLELWAAVDIPRRLPSSLNHVKVLVLSDICYYSLHNILCALSLIRSSPNLLKLNFAILNNIPVQEPVAEFLQAQDFSDFALNQLWKVKIRHFSGFGPEMVFVKILLAHSTMLEKMKILPHLDISDGEGFEILKALTRLPKASPKAEVLYINQEDS